jgi:predicted O-methyltransferase YrrM
MDESTQTPANLLDENALRQRAIDLLDEYREAVRDIVPEAGFGGVWESEMLLFYAAVKPFAPRQILESGRGRGKSTCILACCFPAAEIISVELNPAASNAAAAREKLERYSNVTLISGDSADVLPERLQQGDAVLIDGPKDFNAISLALQLLKTGKPCTVFMHDFPANTAPRKFVAQHWPAAFFSDDPTFESFRSLDDERDPLLDKRVRRYGTFACLPRELPRPASRLRFDLLLARVASHLTSGRS